MSLGGRRFLLSLAILAAAVSLALGVSMPIMKLTKFVFFTTEHSLITTVASLLRNGQHLLGITVLVFSIVLPVVKLFYLLLLATLPITELRRWSRELRALEWLGKWSMHDVLVLSLTIFFIKSQGVYDARSLNGVYFFTAAIVFMILAYAWLKADVDGCTIPAEEIIDSPPPSTAPFRNVILSFLIIAATVALVLGIVQPAVRFTTAYVWKNDHSIASILLALWQSNEVFLCVVIGIFSIIFPFFKLLYLLTLVTSPDMPQEFRVRSMAAMEWLGRYSMTDVMVLALIIFYVNSLGYVAAQPESGLYWFMASTFLTMAAYAWANSVAPKPRRAASASRPVAEPRRAASTPVPPPPRWAEPVATRALPPPHRPR
jgi:paraquat-inducible protein A